MGWPLIQDYQDAIIDPKYCFRDPELASGKTINDKNGFPIVSSGSFATVFKLQCINRYYAVRCFTRYNPDQQQRYEKISRFLEDKKSPYFAKFQFFNQEIKIEGKLFPILKMEWIEGLTLNRYIEKNLNNPAVLDDLAKKFYDLILHLRYLSVAHGDLQHGNIIVSNGQLKLVDYDGIFISPLSGLYSNEIGHHNYQHPKRTANDFDEYLDNFSSWVIYLSIKALSKDPSLWKEFDGGDDCIIYRKSDFEKPFESKSFKKTAQINDKTVINCLNNLKVVLAVNNIAEIPPLNPDEVITPIKPKISLFGEIEIVTTPDIAKVYINDRYYGTTPLKTKISEGSHVYKIQLANYETITNYFSIQKGERLKISKPLVPLKQSQSTGKDRNLLFIASNPPGAAVYVDGSFKGITPISLDSLLPGDHDVWLYQSGHHDEQRKVKLTGKNISITVNFIKQKNKNGYLNIDSSPPGAEVFLNSKHSGYSPIHNHELSPGVYSVYLRKDGYKIISDTISIQADQKIDKSYALEAENTAPPKTGSYPTGVTILIDSKPQGASVYLDSQVYGNSPIRINNVSPGSHTIELLKTGFEGIIETIYVPSGGHQIDKMYNLQPSKPAGTSAKTELIIDSIPGGAEIYIDLGFISGVTPITIEGLIPGSHHLTLKKSGYSDINDNIQIKSGTPNKLFYGLEKKQKRNPSIAAILGFFGGSGQIYNGKKWYYAFLIPFLFCLAIICGTFILSSINNSNFIMFTFCGLINSYICYSESKSVNKGVMQFHEVSGIFILSLIFTIIAAIIYFEAIFS